METIRNNQMKISTEMRNDFDGLLSRLDTDKGRINELENRAIEITQTETQEKKLKQKQKQERALKGCKIISNSLTYGYSEFLKEEREREREWSSRGNIFK